MIPKKCVKVRGGRVMTEEQKEKAIERGRMMAKARFGVVE